MKIITISAYDRVEYLKEVLEHLFECYGIENYKLRCFIDPSPRQQEVTWVLMDYFKQSKLDITWEINHQRLDCNGNIFRCLDFGFQHANYVIHIEDDIVLAKDALLYLEHCDRTYKDDRSIFSVCTYNRYSHRTYQPKSSTTVFRQKHFDPWGWATWKNRWEEEIRENWQFGYGPRYNKEGEMVLEVGGWDINMQTIIRKNQRRINPNYSRSKNIGEYGRHTPSVEFHRGVHNITHWSNDLEFDSNIQFTEAEAEVQHD